MGAQMSADPVIAQAQLTPCFGSSESIDGQLLKRLILLDSAKRERETADLGLVRMAQFVVHDLRHHLSTIYANAEFMRGKANSLSDREELFGEISAAIVCMTDQLDALLLLSRTGCAFHLRRQFLKQVIERAIRMVRSHPDTELVHITSEDMPFAEGVVDGKWLCSAIFNLLLNACQSARLAPELREVCIALHQDLHHVSIRVTDSGPGVSPSIRETLFQPFASADRRDGTGLGLSIADCVAREHGGEVYLEESRPGRTSFVLRLPNPNKVASTAVPT